MARADNARYCGALYLVGGVRVVCAVRVGCLVVVYRAGLCLGLSICRTALCRALLECLAGVRGLW